MLCSRWPGPLGCTRSRLLDSGPHACSAHPPGTQSLADDEIPEGPNRAFGTGGFLDCAGLAPALPTMATCLLPPTPGPNSRWALGGTVLLLPQGPTRRIHSAVSRLFLRPLQLLSSPSSHQGRPLPLPGTPFSGQTHSRARRPAEPGVRLSSTNPPDKQKVMHRGRKSPAYSQPALA